MLTPNQPPVIERLFIRLAAIYGNTWKGIYKNDEFLKFAKNEWLEALINYTEKTIYQAVCLCREQQKFPPTLPEFIDYCRQLNRKESFFEQEPLPKADPNIAAANLKKIKAILNMNT